MKAIRIHEHGGPEVLRLEEMARPLPCATEVLVKNEAIGVNFVDTQHRAGLYYPVALPLVPGIEAAGVVEAVGPLVTEFTVGDRVGYAGYMGGVYAEYTVVPEARLVPVPPTVDAKGAAASLLQGMTAHFLVHDAYPVREGDTVLIHAAAAESVSSWFRWQNIVELPSLAPSQLLRKHRWRVRQGPITSSSPPPRTLR